MLAEWQQLLDLAIHDLRAPLRGIGTSAELLVELCGERLDEEARRLVRTILDGVARIETLSKSLADYSQALPAGTTPSGSTRTESALRSALTTLEQQIRSSGARVDYGPLPRVRGSHEQLSVLFRNLLNNALIYHGPEPPCIRITAEREQDQWCFAVRDNGIGIEPRYWDQIFQPFQRLHAANRTVSIGLGLTICQKIVEAHGGAIWVKSVLQAGSTFFFTLPAEIPEAEIAGGAVS
jgi:chemotaxis family two-component system sensor kinase Cph1